MLTRIQSLYLLLAAMLALGSMTQPFWIYQTSQTILFGDFTQVQGSGLIVTAGGMAGSIFSPLTGITSIAAIFLFKNRKLQQMLIMLCIILFAGDILSGLIAAHFLNEFLHTGGTAVTHSPSNGFFMLLPEPVLFWLALTGVKKDEKIATAYKRL
ncbi:MAG: DUF4293 domain-containing protein [Chlorobiaceae bacterium]|nr:DUF4293 domain-containing protein [Chlorobiaceae bacterium]